MYPSRFHYEAPSSIDEALQLLSMYQGEAKVLSGGMSLIPLMKLRFASPSAIIDVNNIPGLDDLFEDGGQLRIGALVRNRGIIRSDVVRSRYPLMASVAPQIADPLVRGRSTLVGSLCHCDPQGDWGAVMLALEGEVVAVSSSGERRIPVTDFLLGPFQTSLRPDELAIEARDAVHVDEHARRREAQLHQRDQALSAGEHLRVVAVLAERRHGLVDGSGLDVVELGGDHWAPPAVEAVWSPP